jgi:DMSO/TMAO reductase YedYZ molybdopterin-dependent catalytic subunit
MDYQGRSFKILPSGHKIFRETPCQEKKRPGRRTPCSHVGILPIEYFRTAITPKTWKIVVGGEGANGQAEFTLDDLKRLPAAELVAVNLCSGNRRGLFQPHVPGVQWSNGAMGCALWKGARLKDLLDKAGLKKEAIEIVFDGADSGVTDKTPDFIKSIPTWKAIEDTTLVAYEMNGAPLPHLHGFPARVVVPGWTGVYWMKHVTSISAVTKPESGFWMNTAYRIPRAGFQLLLTSPRRKRQGIRRSPRWS